MKFDHLSPIAENAFIWGFPLTACARIRVRSTNPDEPFVVRPPSSSGAPINRWGHQRVPADPDFRVGPGPSVDLLYSSVRLDLDHGPFVLEFPDCGDRYYTAQIAFADSSAELSLGQRTHGPRLPPVLIAGPAHAEAEFPEGVEVVFSPTRYCMVPTRFHFDPADPGDLDRVQALQSALRVRTLGDFLAAADELPAVVPQRPLRPEASDIDPDLLFLYELGAVVQDWVVGEKDRSVVASLTEIGITIENGFRPETLDPSSRSAIVRGLEQGRRRVTERSLQLGVDHEGWTTNYLGPRFGDDLLLRAAVAKDQIIVTVPEEALYPVARCDRDGEPLRGDHRYRWRLAGDQVPDVGAFWSITAYDDDGFLVDNALGRYAIGMHTPGLTRSADGGLEITLSHSRPPGDGENWLPVPSGRFYLMMRLYLPGEQVLSGRWQPPGLRRIS